MADNDWKKRLGVVFSTNPDFAYEEEAEAENRSLLSQVSSELLKTLPSSDVPSR